MKRPHLFDVRFPSIGAKNRSKNPIQTKTIQNQTESYNSYMILSIIFPNVTLKNHSEFQASYQTTDAIALSQLTEASGMTRIFSTAFSAHSH